MPQPGIVTITGTVLAFKPSLLQIFGMSLVVIGGRLEVVAKYPLWADELELGSFLLKLRFETLFLKLDMNLSEDFNV